MEYMMIQFVEVLQSKDYIREVEQRLGICDRKNKAKSSELGMLSKHINSCKRKQTMINVLKEENKKRREQYTQVNMQGSLPKQGGI